MSEPRKNTITHAVLSILRDRKSATSGEMQYYLAHQGWETNLSRASAIMCNLADKGFVSRDEKKRAGFIVYRATKKEGWPLTYRNRKEPRPPKTTFSPPETPKVSPREELVANETVNLMAVVLDVVNLARKNKHFKAALLEALND